MSRTQLTSVSPIPRCLSYIILSFASARWRHYYSYSRGIYGECITEPAAGKRFHWNQRDPGRRLLRHSDGPRDRKLSHLRHEGPPDSDSRFWHGEAGRG